VRKGGTIGRQLQSCRVIKLQSSEGAGKKLKTRRAGWISGPNNLTAFSLTAFLGGQR